jgi:hypothetical protein
MKKTALTLIVAAVFLVGLSVNGFSVVRVARANPFEAPAWTILSPKNNTVYNTDSFNLTFRAVSNTGTYEFFYSLDAPIAEVFLGGQGTPIGQGKTFVNATLVSVTPGEGASKIRTFQCSSKLPNLTDGQHNLTLYYGYNNNFDFRRELASATIIFYINSAAPKITNLSINNQDAGNIMLDFTVDKATSWLRYSLDNQANVTVNGDVILKDLSTGFHHVTVYAEDEAGHKSASETLCFTVESETPYFAVEEPDLVPLVLVSMGTCFAVCVGLLVYFKKRKNQTL